MGEDKDLPGKPAGGSEFVPFRIFNKSEKDTRGQITGLKENLTEKITDNREHIGLLREAQKRHETDICDLKKRSERQREGLEHLSFTVDRLTEAVRETADKTESFLASMISQTETWSKIGQKVMDMKETVDEIKERLSEHDPKELSKEINDPDTGLKKRVANLETTFEHLPWKFAKALGSVLVGILVGGGGLYALWIKILWPFFQKMAGG